MVSSGEYRMKKPCEQLDRREFLKSAARATTAGAAFASVGSAAAPLVAWADQTVRPPGSRISYYRNGEICVGELGKPEGRPLTTGHVDFKPSWSRTGDMLVCFRRTKDDPVTANWKSAIFVIGADGAGFHLLSDGTRTDFNPTWTRDGSNTPIWNRRNERTGGYFVMQARVDGKPGQERTITDERFHSWAHSCLMDGRILVNSAHPSLGWGVFLLSTRSGREPVYESVQWELGDRGQMHRASISPSEAKICFEFLPGSSFTEAGHILYVGDFDPRRRTVSNLKAFANKEGRKIWFAYPRWIEGETAVIYHSGETGTNQLYVYRLDDGSIRRVSKDANADYRYPHGEAAPC
jgi:Tol biopolymer transport system component